jgi:hypothetical protein
LKAFLRQLILFALSLGLTLQSQASPGFCSAVYLPKIFTSPSTLKSFFLPHALRNFDSDLYWKVRTNSFSELSLSPKEMKRIEVKLALIDQLLPEESLAWSKRLSEMNLLRVRQMNSLFSRYQLKDLSDSYLRRQLITQLYLLEETPWMGLAKAIRLSTTETVQGWASRTFEQRVLSQGLKNALKEMLPNQPAHLASARLILKKLFRSGWLNLPQRLPQFNRNLDSELIEKLLWEGVKPNEQALVSLMNKDHLIEAYDHFTRLYAFAATVAVVAIMYSMLPQLQDQFDREFAAKQKEAINDPENIKKRNEKFQQTMNSLDQMDQRLDQELAQLQSQDPKQRLYQDTLSTFETLNHRSATEAEKQSLRQQLGLSNGY